MLLRRRRRINEKQHTRIKLSSVLPSLSLLFVAYTQTNDEAILLAFLFYFSVFQASNGFISIINDENKTIAISTEEMAAMPHISIDVKAHDVNMHSYSGVVLMNLLQKAGVKMGDSVKKNVA